MTEWVPATDAETEMQSALRRGDQEQYFRILSRAALLLPVSADALAGRSPMGWGTWTSHGRIHILAFTSPDAMRACLAEHTASSRQIMYRDLALNWPNSDWWLAVDPGLPIEGYLPAWFVTQLAHGDVRLPGRARGMSTVTAARDTRGGGMPDDPGERDAARAHASRTPGLPGPRQAPQEPPGEMGRRAAVPPRRFTPPDQDPGSAAGLPRRPVSPAAPRGGPSLVPGGPPLAPGGPAAAPDRDGPPIGPGGLPRRPVPAAPGGPGGDASSMGPGGLPRRPVPAAAFTDRDAGAVDTGAGDRTANANGSTPTATGGTAVGAETTAGEDRSDTGTSGSGGATRAPVPPATATGSMRPVSTPDLPARTPDAHRGVWAAVEGRRQASGRTAVDAEQVQSPRQADEPARRPYYDTPTQAIPIASDPNLPDAAPATAGGSPGSAAVEFTPANEVEENLLSAASSRNTDGFLSVLLLAKVLVPVDGPSSSDPRDPNFRWRKEMLDGQEYVVVFTSKERLAAHAGDTDAVSVRFVHLISNWPDESWSFAVNPGTPVGATLPGAQVRTLAAWAAEVGLGGDEPSATDQAAVSAAREVPAPREPVAMQKVLPDAHVAYYLERGYDRVSGFVYRVSEAAHLATPERIYTGLGLVYPGSSFEVTDPEVYVLRWVAHCEGLYRIPYGGQNESGMRAMQGWVIERAPFRGNGFAPGTSGDVIAEFKVDSARLPHGAQMWRFGRYGGGILVATLDVDSGRWLPVQRERT